MTTESKAIRFDMVDDAMAEVLRSKTPAQRLASAHDMWRYAHKRVNVLLRGQHPDWNDSQLKAEIRRRMLGSD